MSHPRFRVRERLGDGEARLSGGTGVAYDGPMFEQVSFDEKGLVPCVAQDFASGEVLTLAYANEESLRLTVETGELHFYSRSREEIWRKGETSGNVLKLRQLRYDCDGDAIVALVEPSGPACHTGERSCFYRDARRRARAGRPRGAGGARAHPAQPRRGAPRGQLHRRAARRPEADRRQGRGGGRGGRPRRPRGVRRAGRRRGRRPALPPQRPAHLARRAPVGGDGGAQWPSRLSPPAWASSPSLEEARELAARGQRGPGPGPLRRRLRDAGLGLPQAARRRGARGALLPARVRRAGPGRPLLVRRHPAALGPALERRGAERGRRARRSRTPDPYGAVADAARRLRAGAGRGPAALRRRRRRLLRLRPGAHGRAARRAQPRPARPARHGADDHRRAARLRPPQARADDHVLRLRRARARSTPPTSARRRRSPTSASACAAPCPSPSTPTVSEPPRFTSNMEREEFEAAVARIVEYVHAGDAFQVVPSQRFSAPAPVDAFSVYRGLRAVNPSPVHVLPRVRRLPDRRRLARAAGQGQRRPGRDAADRRHLAARAQRGGGPPLRRAADQRPQGAGRARDARRPRPQRPRPRLRVRQRSRSTS